ncbi:gluconolactonase [Algibacter lectus]|uniref:Gluconolactonase n=1 Tax=Algibacter lectus TaxID=221126 RepID=A0A090WYN6_9FLAO|nr:SMP-30/gluconolactonase/LRE family protein [Algibacter lectus]GAL82081.1 gluconolactonase [Algibacter lectus]
MKANLLLDAKASLGEGPVYLSGSQELLWVDIHQGEVHCFQINKKEDYIIYKGNKPSCIIPLKNNEFLIADTNKLLKFDKASQEYQLFLNLDFKDDNIRFNDGKMDPYGNIWIGTMDINVTPKQGALYRIDNNKMCFKVLEGITISNGLAWSQDAKTMYYIDTYENVVFGFDFNSNCDISNQRIVIDIPKDKGAPDGMTIDSQGNLWIALWGGNAVICCDPKTGELKDKIEVDAPHVTSCTLGGEMEDVLFITTARDGLSSDDLIKYPLSGGLFFAKIK